MTNIVKNNSEANRYTYASLSDIVEQGFTLPKMKTMTEGEREYVCYYDGNEWIRGAEIVVPSAVTNKDGKASMNEAQLYGSALTYARRYTTLMALQLACQDDKEIEDNTVPMATEKQIEYIKSLYDVTRLAKMMAYYKVDKLVDLNINQAKEAIEAAKKGNEKHNQ